MPARRTKRYSARNTRSTRSRNTRTRNTQNARSTWGTTSRTRNANGKPWSKQEMQALRKVYKDTPTKDIARKFRRSVSSVQAKAGSMGLKKTKSYMKQMRQNQWR